MLMNTQAFLLLCYIKFSQLLSDANITYICQIYIGDPFQIASRL